MTDEEVQSAWEAAKKSVTVSCDEYHAHSARQGCLSGDANAVAVCRMAEALLSERKLIREAAAAVGR